MEFVWNDNHLEISIDETRLCCFSLYEDSGLDTTEFGLALLQSAYYFENELDYQILRSDSGDIVGTILPIAFLACEDESIKEIVNKESIFKIADVALKLLLKKGLEDENKLQSIINEHTDFKISDLYPEKLSVLVYRKSMILDVSDYVQSLYINGYVLYDKEGVLYVSDIIKKETEQRRLERRHNLKIKPNSKFFSFDNKYFKALFYQLLPFSKDPFYRYLALYQVFEMMITIGAETKLKEAVSQWLSSGQEMRNCREKITETSKEKTNLNWALEGCTQDTTLFREFIDKAKNLYTSAGFTSDGQSTYVDWMYSIRNAIVHNLRVVQPFMNEMKELSDLYELTVSEILFQKEDLIKPSDLRLFIIDKTKSKDANIHNMESIYDM